MHWESVPEAQLLPFFSDNSEIFVATDGGFDLEKGTGSFGAMIADQTKTIATVLGSAPGDPDLHCSFRSEMYGLLAACSLLNEVVQFHRIHVEKDQMKIQFFLDSQSTIDRVSNHLHNPIPLKDMTGADMDIELQILQELWDLGEIKGFAVMPFQHVKCQSSSR